MLPAKVFLEHILPVEGYKCATIISEKRTFNRFFGTCAEVAQFSLTQDALGLAAYHACSSFQTVENRKQTNVLATKALWLDVDAGPGKPYADATAAWQAVETFRGSVGLPTPTYVCSGHGVHSYWVLAEALRLEAWRAVSNQLRLLCAREQLEADQVRTCDASSILRPPGTHNRKFGALALVQAGELTGPYKLEDLGELNVGQPERSLPLLPHAQRVPFRGVSGTLDAAGNIYTEQPSDPNLIADKCRQVGELRSKNGNVIEPHWYAAIAVLGTSSEGKRAAHDWSSGYPGYTVNETEERLNRSQGYGPTTCAYFESINPKGCEGCPSKGKVTSPIQLGRVGNVQTASGGPQASSGVPAANGQKVSSFLCQADGLWFLAEDNQGQEAKTLISSAPIKLTTIQTGEITTDSFSLGFDLKLPNGDRDIILPAKTFFSASGMSEMAGHGAVIHEPDLFRKYVRETMDIWHKENRLEMRYDQFGWKDEDTAFLFGSNLYRSEAITPIIGSEEIKLRSQWLGPKSGSLDRWSAAANALFTRGCEPQSFALLAAFAAALMRFHSGGEGGAIVSLVSDQSGSGKTTALEAVASVWGKLKGTQLTDDDTRVSKGLMLGVLGNLPCVYDELYNRDPEAIRQFVIMFTNGRDRLRGTQDGQLRHTKAEWQTILVLASNLSIVDVLSSMDGSDAQAYRVLEFTCSLPDGVDNGDALKRELAANSGWAGDLFLRTLLQPGVLDYVKGAIEEWTSNIWKKTGFENKHRFWVRTLASVAAAGVIVKHAGILDFSIQRIVDWAIEELRTQAAQSSDSGVRMPSEVLSEFLHAHLNDMLVVPTAFKPRSPSPILISPKRELLVRYEISDGVLYIANRALRKWLVKYGVNRKAFIAELLERQVFKREFKRVTLGAGTDFASGQIDCVEVNMKHPIMSGMAIAVEKLTMPSRFPGPEQEMPTAHP